MKIKSGTRIKWKHIALVLAVVMFSVLLCACAAKDGSRMNSSVTSDETSSAGRVVVYTYYSDVYADDINTANSKITAIVADFAQDLGANGCYVKRSEKENDYAYYTIKLDSSSFNAFVARIGELGDISYERTESQDVTEYSSGEKNVLSTLNIHVYLNGSNNLSFNDKVWNAVGFVWSTIMGNIFAIIILILPFAAIITGITVAVHYLLKHLRRKEEKAKEKTKGQGTDNQE